MSLEIKQGAPEQPVKLEKKWLTGGGGAVSSRPAPSIEVE